MALMLLGAGSRDACSSRCYFYACLATDMITRLKKLTSENHVFQGSHLCVMFEAIKPGATAFTDIFLLESSKASDFTIPEIAAFDEV